METAESYNNVPLSQLNHFSSCSTGKFKLSRKLTQDYEATPWVLEENYEDEDPTHPNNGLCTKIEVYSNEDNSDHNSLHEDIPQQSMSKRLMESSLMIEKLCSNSGLSTASNSRPRMVSIRRTNDVPEEISGYLTKRSANFFKGWQKRYVVLRRNRILYYKHHTCLHPVGIVNLSLVNATVETYQKHKLKFSIWIDGWKRKFKFKAKSEEDKNRWCSALVQSIKRNDLWEKDSYLLKETRFWKKWDRISEENFLKEADSGDILLFTGKTVMSGITRKITNSNYDHVAMILTFVDDPEIYFLESTSSGVHITTWNQLKTYKDKLYQRVVWRRLNWERNPQFWEILGTFVNAVDDMRYNISLKKLLRRKSTLLNESEILDTDRVVKKGRTFFWSELVAKAYKTLGILVSSKSWTTIYPKHFSTKKNLGLTNASLGEELMISFPLNH